VHCEPGSVRRCGDKSVIDRLYSRYHDDTDGKLIQPNISSTVAAERPGYITFLHAAPVLIVAMTSHEITVPL